LLSLIIGNEKLSNNIKMPQHCIMGDSSIELSPNFLFIVAAPIKTASIIINSKIIPLRIFETNFF